MGQGDLLGEMEAAGAPTVDEKPENETQSATKESPPSPQQAEPAPAQDTKSEAQKITVEVPDIGDFQDIPVIEILVSAGDKVEAEDPLVVLESDKATMEVPAPTKGTVLEILTTVGAKVSQGTPVISLQTEAEVPSLTETSDAGPQKEATAESTPQASSAPPAPKPASAEPTRSAQALNRDTVSYTHLTLPTSDLV